MKQDKVIEDINLRETGKVMIYQSE